MVSGGLTQRAVVIGDLVGSRGVADRAGLHEELVAALEVANTFRAPVEALAPTIGDEFQGVFHTLADAIDATLLVRASMPPEHDVRFGVGVGALTRFSGTGAGFARQDGPAWWVARDAIEYVTTESRSRSGSRTLRTWAASHPSEPVGVRVIAPVYLPEDPVIAAVNAYFLTRDHLVSRMDARDRRILKGLLLARGVGEIAAAEGITSSAVSQRIARSGATAILASRDLLGACL